jgi:hypothetical protein
VDGVLRCHAKKSKQAIIMMVKHVLHVILVHAVSTGLIQMVQDGWLLAQNGTDSSVLCKLRQDVLKIFENIDLNKRT